MPFNVFSIVLRQWIKKPSLYALFLPALTTALVLHTHLAKSQPYPTKPLRLIVPFSTGSGSDTLARVFSNGLGQTLQQTIVVENRAGAAGNIGAQIAAHATPDGYHLLLVNIAHAINVSIYKNPGYEPLRDFAMVSLIASGPALLVVHPSIPAHSLPQLIRLAKAQPGTLHQASGGNGTFTSLCAELFKRVAGIQFLHVPYRSGGEALSAVLSNEVNIYFSPVSGAIHSVKQNRLRALAISSAHRLDLLPDLPTIAENGFPHFEVGNWYGLVLPAKAPVSRIQALSLASQNTLHIPTVQQHLKTLGLVTIGHSPEVFTSFFAAEINRWRPIMQSLPFNNE